jgi:hypothetical protein
MRADEHGFKGGFPVIDLCESVPIRGLQLD